MVKIVYIISYHGNQVTRTGVELHLIYSFTVGLDEVIQ